ncbi:MAG: hypothetical protein JNG88_02060 [Phycisphaerales bacterium]|nr:hypothetical protein [Phycisphaerales bacterium]
MNLAPVAFRRMTMIALTLLAIGMFGCPTTTNTGDGNNDGDNATLGENSVQVGDYERTYSLYTPASFQNGTETPIVVVLHGIGLSGDVALADGRWKEKADNEGFVVVGPDALPTNPDEPVNLLTNQRTWESTQFSLGGSTSNRDVLFFDSLLTDLSSKLGFTVSSVYVAGHSEGGSMAFILASERGSKVRAIAAVASHWIGLGPQPDPPTPTIYIVGSEDPIVPIEDNSGGILPSAEFTLQRWALALGCGLTPTTVSNDGQVQIDQYNNCDDNVPFTAYTIFGQGHSWPGGTLPLSLVGFGPSTDYLNATDTVWDFFVGVEQTIQSARGR